MPERIQRQRVRGWRMPENTVSVTRPLKWGNPFAYHSRNALARVPALDGSAWEYEGRISAHGGANSTFTCSTPTGLHGRTWDEYPQGHQITAEVTKRLPDAAHPNVPMPGQLPLIEEA